MTATEACQEASITAGTINDFVRTIFGPEATKFDYKVVAAMTRLYIQLPGSHSFSSFVKTLRGKAIAPVCKNRPEFGMLEGMKEYTSGKLMCLGRHLDRLLKAGDVTEDEDLPAPAGENQSRAPEWIQTKQVSKNWGNKIAAAFEACGEEYGVDKPAPTKKVKDQAKIRPKVLQAKMTKMAFFRKAYEKGLVLGNEFAAANPEWEVGTFASTPVFRSKSIQGDKLVVTWRMEQFWEELEPEVRCKFGFTKRTKFLKPGDRYETSRNETKEMILTTTWNQDASVLIDWNVELVDGPTSEW